MNSDDEHEYDIGDKKHFDNWQYDIGDPTLPPKMIKRALKKPKEKEFFERDQMEI